MPRLFLYTTVTALFLLYSNAEAANTINWTFYGPGAAGWMQGPMTASQKDLEGKSNGIHTLDDVRTGKSKYVTLASASVMKGRFYCIGTVTYTSPPGNGGDGKTHTLENVVGYVHDTGCAFNGTCSCARLPQFCDGKPRTDKMDIAVGNFNGYSAEFAMNYITKNPNRAPKDWTQIAGIPAQGTQAAAATPCGGVVKEQGTPVNAAYTPPPTFAPTNPLQQQITPQQQPAQQYQLNPAQSQLAPTGVSTGVNTGTTQTGNTVTGAVEQYAQPAPYGDLQTSNPTGGAVLTVSAMQPTQTVQTVPSGILPTLFQQTSVTSSLRILQNAAQSITDLLTVPSITGGAQSNLTGQSVHITQDTSASAQAITYDTNNISLMAISQSADAAQQLPAPLNESEPVRSNQPQGNPVLQALTQQRENTFDVASPAPGVDSNSTQTNSLLIKILASFRALLEGILRSLTRS